MGAVEPALALLGSSGLGVESVRIVPSGDLQYATKPLSSYIQVVTRFRFHGRPVRIALRSLLQSNVHRSQNRTESYHQLCPAIAQMGGNKELTGRTDIQIEISNECARLIANAIIYYNSAILSRLFVRHEASGNAKALAMTHTSANSE